MKLHDFIEFAFTDLGPSPVRPIMRCLFIEQSKLLQFHWKSKQENYFFPQLTISITRIQTKKKTGLRVAAVTLLSWCKLRRGNNQPTRINLLINFNSSREEPGGAWLLYQQCQGSPGVNLTRNTVNVDLKDQFHIENVSRTATT